MKFSLSPNPSPSPSPAASSFHPKRRGGGVPRGSRSGSPAVWGCRPLERKTGLDEVSTRRPSWSVESDLGRGLAAHSRRVLAVSRRALVVSRSRLPRAAPRLRSPSLTGPTTANQERPDAQDPTLPGLLSTSASSAAASDPDGLRSSLDGAVVGGRPHRMTVMLNTLSTTGSLASTGRRDPAPDARTPDMGGGTGVLGSPLSSST